MQGQTSSWAMPPIMPSVTCPKCGSAAWVGCLHGLHDVEHRAIRACMSCGHAESADDITAELVERTVGPEELLL